MENINNITHEPGHHSAEFKAIMLSKKIERALSEKRLSRVAFANIMGVQPSIITRWLSGKHNFTVETLFQIEASLNIKLLAIDLPDVKSQVYHIRVNSDAAVFQGVKEFPDFTSINLREDQTDNIWTRSPELEHYLAILTHGMDKNGK